MDIQPNIPQGRTLSRISWPGFYVELRAPDPRPYWCSYSTPEVDFGDFPFVIRLWDRRDCCIVMSMLVMELGFQVSRYFV